jgi:hypothetical protein
MNAAARGDDYTNHMYDIPGQAVYTGLLLSLKTTALPV